MNTNDNEANWNKMSTEERASLLRASDPTMTSPDWAPLVAKMAATEWEKLTKLQRAMLEEVL